MIPGSGRSTGEGIGYPLQCSWASFVAQRVKNPPATWETWVRSLGWEGPLKKGKATHSSILACRIPWTVLFHGVAESDTTERLSLSLRWSWEDRRGSSRAVPLKISHRKNQSQVPTGKHVPSISYKQSPPQQLRQKPSPL